MFSLASGIYKQLTEKVEYNVIIVGPDNAGKSVSMRWKLIYFKIDYRHL